MNIAVCLPKTLDRNIINAELEAAASGEADLNFRVPWFPKQTKIGDRCYLYWRGKCLGWHAIKELVDTDLGFTCTTTGRQWKGKFIRRSGAIQAAPEAPPLLPFRGFKYVDF